VKMCRTIKYGDWDVPVLIRSWVAPARLPYRKTYRLKAGQNWSEAPTTELQWEHYVVLPDGQPAPVGVLIARELVTSGATAAAFTELWAGTCVLVGPDLVCISDDSPLHELVVQIRAATGGRLGGLPDVLAVFPDGRIAMREAKNVAAKDRLGPKQHSVARVVQRLFGARLDLRVVEWGVADSVFG
jgi:hypothetical protein